MSGGYARRWRDRLLVVFALLVLGGLAVPLASLFVGAWETHGLLFHLTRMLGNVGLLGGVDAVDFLLVGLVVGWLTLFALDSYKWVQAVVLLVTAPLFVVGLQAAGRWDELPVLENVPWLVLGVVVALGTGVYASSVRNLDEDTRSRVPVLGRYRLTFPTAARALYGFVWVAVVLALLERHLVYRSPVVADGAQVAPAAPELTLAGTVLNLLAGSAFLLFLGYFVEYSDQKEVLIASRSDTSRAVPNLIGALYTQASRAYGGRPTVPDVGGDLGRIARRLNGLSGEPGTVDGDALRPLAQALAFEYRLSGLLRRSTIVETDLTAGNTLEEFETRLVGTRRVRERAGRVGRQLARRLFPATLRGLYPSATRTGWRRLARADTLLMVAPLTDCIDTAALEDEDIEDWTVAKGSAPTYVGSYASIQSSLGDGSPRPFIVATDGHLAEQLYRLRNSEPPTSGELEAFVKNSLFGVGPNVEVTVVSRPRSEGATMDGFDDLLWEL
jgi:hypothetical protein